MKYWVVAKKIQEFYSGSKPKVKVELRARLYLTCFIVLIAVSLLVDIKFMWWNVIQYMLDNNKLMRYGLGLLTTAVPFSVLIFLIHAFMIMRTYHDKF
jgi:hypothetical protein